MVDNFAVLGVEYTLTAILLDTFAPDTVMNLAESLTSEIAAETKDSSDERSRAMKKLNMLKEGLQTLSVLADKSSLVGGSIPLKFTR